MSLWWDKINTLEREPWGDGSPLAAWTKGFSAGRVNLFFFLVQRAAPSNDNLRRLLSNNNTLNNKSNNSHKHLFVAVVYYLGENPGIPLKTSSQPQPPLFMDSRVTMSRGAAAKPKGAGRAQQSVCHCDNLLKGGGQGIIK